jgi:hypothetical protein
MRKQFFILYNQSNQYQFQRPYEVKKNRGYAKVKINIIFTTKGKVAIENFSNEELIEIFIRYSNTLKKKYEVTITVPLEENPNIVADGVMKVTLSDVNCDVEAFFKELGRDIKVPFKKRLNGTLDNVFKIAEVKS